MRLEFEKDGKTLQGDLLGFVSIGYEEPHLNPGVVRGKHIQGGVFDKKRGFIGGYIENPTNVFAMIGCDDGEIRRALFRKCRYVKADHGRESKKHQTLLAALRRWAQRQWLAFQNAKQGYFYK